MRNMSEGFFLFLFSSFFSFLSVVTRRRMFDSGMASEESGHGVAYQRVHVEGPFES